MIAATSPSVMRRTQAPALRQLRMISAWRGRSRMLTVISLAPHALGDRERPDIVAGIAVEIDRAFRISRTDGDLVHVNVGRMQERTGRRHGDDGDRARHVLGAKRRAFERRDAEIDAGTDARADFFADIEHRRGVVVALADHDAAAHGKLATAPRASPRPPRDRRPSRRRVPRNLAAATAARSDARASSNVR